MRLRICKWSQKRLIDRSRTKIGAYNKQGYWKDKLKKPEEEKLTKQ
jgi:hypothetical protein